MIIHNTYDRVYSRSPAFVKKALSSVAHALLSKPRTKPCSLPPAKRFPDPFEGCLVFSADFEMAWAWRYSTSGKPMEAMGLVERENIPVLLNILNKYNIPTTWAIVGHLFLKGCKKSDGPPHPELPRVPHFNDHWVFTEGDWYDHDPCSAVEEAPAWYAPDIIQRIIGSETEHEIGCHTFTHLNCKDSICPANVLEAELDLCRKLASDLNVDLKSFVYPGGTYGNYPALKKCGFSNYRYRDQNHELYYPEKDQWGLWRIPSSENIGANPLSINPITLIKRYRKYIDKAIEKHSVVHFWFHPSADLKLLSFVLSSLADYAWKKRDSGQLWVCTMGQLVQHCSLQSGGIQ